MDNKSTLLLALFFLLIAFPLFYNLDGPPIFIYDEAIYANNALEMAMHGDPLVLKNNGEANLYNTKPPLVIWLQSLAIKIIGPTEWAIRLPSALAALGTVFLLFLFSHRSLKDYRIGMVAALVLVTSNGYLRNHVARSGDLDAMLVFWISFYSLLAFTYLLAPEKKSYRKYFTWIGIGIFAAFMSKSVAGLMPLLGLALAALVQKKLLAILKKPYLYLVAGSVAFACIGYYLLRENAGAGYLEKVIQTEYLRFSENIMPWQNQPFGFYWENLWKQSYFMPYLLALPLAIVLGFWRGEKGTPERILGKNFTLMAMVFCLSYFFLISYPSVKLNYYDAPSYPFLSLLIGLGVVRFWTLLENNFALNRTFSRIGFGLLLLLIFAIPYHNTFKNIQQSAPIFEQEKEGAFMRLLKEKEPARKTYKVLIYHKHPEHYDAVNFYIKGANYYEGAQIDLIHDWKKLASGDQVLCCQPTLKDSLNQHFVLEEQLSEEGSPCVFYQLE